MAYSKELADRIDSILSTRDDVIVKEMMGGLTYMVDNKMCVGIIGEELMCRIDPLIQDMALEKPGCRIMDFTGRPMKGYVMVNDEAMGSKEGLEYWISLSLDFNKRAKSSKKKNK